MIWKLSHAPGNAGEVVASISVPVLHGTTPVTTSLPSLLVCPKAVVHGAVATATARRRMDMDALGLVAIGGIGELRLEWCMYCTSGARSFDLLCYAALAIGEWFV